MFLPEASLYNMEVSNEEDYKTHYIGHLGLVASKIHELDLINFVDTRLPISMESGAKVSMGERVAAMILNGLGFIDSRLYLFPEFLSDKPIDRLFGRAIKAEWFNDDAMGRCLDEIMSYGATKLYTEYALYIGERRCLLGRSSHVDTTTLGVYGDYSKVENEGIKLPQPAQGYSKSGRHDLKQMVLLLATTGAANFPIYMESHSGNASDKETLPTAANRIHALCRGLREAHDFIHVGDSAMYSNILQYSETMHWISRVPENIKAASLLSSMPEEGLAWIQLNEGYSYYSTTSDYKNVAQRWVMFFSKASASREIATLNKRVRQEAQEQEKAWWHLSNEIFQCCTDAEKAVDVLKKKLKFHEVETSIAEVKKHTQRGRPKAGDEPQVAGYQVQYQLSLDEASLDKKRATKGRFILATNILDEAKLSCSELLQEYKAQSGTEASFKFIKNDSFEVDSIFLKTPERIVALMMVMTLCLMIYGLSEFDLRQTLQKREETVPNQLKKQTTKPSMQWVYFLFRSVNELSIQQSGFIQKIVINVNPLLKRIIDYFGIHAQRIYLNPG